MLFILNRIGVRDDGVVEGKLSGTVDGMVAGQGYIAGKPFVATASGTSTDGFVQGFRYSTAGALRIFNAGAGVPTGSARNAGFAVTPDGALCYIGTASASAVTAHMGVKVDPQGRVIMNLTA